MKICWDNLEKLVFKNGYWHKGQNIYEYVESCEICNESFLGVKGRNAIFCSNECCGKFNEGENNVFCRPEVKEKLKQIDRTYLMGSGNVNWKGGKYKDDPRANRKLVDWRKQVYEIDDYTCQECGNRGGDLNAHHIKTVSMYPELIFDVNNGITLCVNCHRKTFFKEELYEQRYKKRRSIG